MRRSTTIPSRRPLPASPRPPSGIDTSRCRARQGARLDARSAATGALESARLDACFLRQRVCVPLDAAVTPVTDTKSTRLCQLRTQTCIHRAHARPNLEQKGDTRNMCYTHAYTHLHGCKHTLIHSYIHTTHTHTYIHTYIHTCMHACMHTYIHTCMHACIHVCMHPYIHEPMHRLTHVDMHACMHMHVCIHAYIHMYIYVCSQTSIHRPHACPNLNKKRETHTTCNT